MNTLRFFLAGFAFVTLSCTIAVVLLFTVHVENWTTFDWGVAICIALLLYPAGIMLCIAAEMLSRAKGWLDAPG